MKPLFLEELIKKLQEEKKELENILSSFSKEKDQKIGDWETKFPQFGQHTSEQDENMDEVEEYYNLLPIEHRLELQLLDVNRALDKINSGKTYGICEKCGGEIEENRLRIIPETKFCAKCANKITNN